ncbi:MAG: hypothetical protein AMJ42_03840 [Deltaproteobacteria bacterium DG_8]|nr:MAG: hypothetical protein AMJ42_03840 [Deltaproteobacteria bacterium DG_8]
MKSLQPKLLAKVNNWRKLNWLIIISGFFTSAKNRFLDQVRKIGQGFKTLSNFDPFFTVKGDQFSLSEFLHLKELSLR